VTRPRNVLVVLNAGLGNVIMSVPVLTALCGAAPAWRLALLSSQPTAEVSAALPAGVRVLPAGTPPLWRRFREQDHAAIFEFIEHHGIDLILNLRKEAPANDYEYRAFREVANRRGIDCWDLHELEIDEIIHVPFAQQTKSLLEKHGLELKTPTTDYLAWMRRPPKVPVAGLFLGASRGVKRWQARRWREVLAAALGDAPDLRLQLASGHTPAERRLLIEVASGQDPRRVEVVEPADFPAVMSWICTLSALVAGDTAALHVAFAQGVPAVHGPGVVPA
jgi:ADP-heptose:LPS heptosyltransferase